MSLHKTFEMSSSCDKIHSDLSSTSPGTGLWQLTKRVTSWETSCWSSISLSPQSIVSCRETLGHWYRTPWSVSVRRQATKNNHFLVPPIERVQFTHNRGSRKDSEWWIKMWVFKTINHYITFERCFKMILATLDRSNIVYCIGLARRIYIFLNMHIILSAKIWTLSAKNP